MIQVGQYVFCSESIVPVRSDFKDQAEIVTQLLFGEVGTILATHYQWIKIKSAHDHYEGWIDQKQVLILPETTYHTVLKTFKRQFSRLSIVKSSWGDIHTVMGSFLPNEEPVFEIGQYTFEVVNPEKISIPEDISKIALEYNNAPYLWGGRTPFGIDCSGFTQAVYRFYEIELPRDASQQEKTGTEVKFEEIKKGDIAYFHNEKGNVTHVGIVLDNFSFIHASGRIRIDRITSTGIFNDEMKKETHQLHSIKRILT